MSPGGCIAEAGWHGESENGVDEAKGVEMNGDETDGVDTSKEFVICPLDVLAPRFGSGDEDFGEGYVHCSERSVQY
ncbi:hypothetical protein IFR04_015026 [Cadophora malorum]|uniref:Uncharacterized protein n=1 Tax=Cadophora malorum TaxID=108018 RepID=A0A8H7T3U9_9HELO|nr:hypothetical protein IFR04_015026 [Cadophora malorum]